LLRWRVALQPTARSFGPVPAGGGGEKTSLERCRTSELGARQRLGQEWGFVEMGGGGL
jgi:hypothetical protein